MKEGKNKMKEGKNRSRMEIRRKRGGEGIEGGGKEGGRKDLSMYEDQGSLLDRHSLPSINWEHLNRKHHSNH